MTDSTTLNINQIKDIIAHRYPFLLVDRVLESTPHERLVAMKNVTVNEPYFNGHFPAKPVMPGVLMVEALAQAACVLNAISYPETQDKLLYLVEVRNARFKRLVVPGDQLKLNVTVEKIRGDYLRFAGEATVDGEVACSATIIGMRAS